MMPTPTNHAPLEPGQLLPISARITTGSFVVFTEGVAATLLFMLPRDKWYFMAGLILAIAFLGLAEVFRRYSKLAADISDLFFYEALVWVAAGGLYAARVEQDVTWYLGYILSYAKLIRLYAAQDSITATQGWGVFGPMTYLYAKKYAPGLASQIQPQQYRALAMAFSGAVIGAVAVKYVPDVWRVVLAWVVPLAFELWFGPRQLSSLAQFVPAFLAGSQREAAQLAEIERLKKALAASQLNQGLPPDPALAELVASYNGTTPARRAHLVFYAANVAEAFPEGEPEVDD